MNCNAAECHTSSAHHLWKCSGTCGRSFHAACIGAKRDWEDTILNYVLPLCQQCSSNLVETVDLRKILDRQMECQHKIITQLKNITNMQEAIETIEKRMTSLERQWCEGAKNNNKIIDALSAAPKQTSSADTTDLLKEVVRELGGDIAKSIDAKIDAMLNRIVDRIDGDRTDLLAIASASNNDMPKKIILEIMDEVKLLSSCAKIIDTTPDIDSLPPPESLPSLMDELTDESPKEDENDSNPQSPVENVTDDATWHVMGPKKVWCSEADYAALKSALQQKSMQRRNSRINNNRNNNTRNSSNKNFNYQNNTYRNNRTNNNNNISYNHNNNNNHNHNNIHNNNRSHNNNSKNNRYNNNNNRNNRHNNGNNNTSRNYQTQNIDNGNNHSNSTSRRIQSNINDDVQPSCSYDYYNNNNTHNKPSSKGNPCMHSLPLDKDLLAAAKQTFSRPPAARHRGIRFQQGETLNPYPVDPSIPLQNPSSSHNWTLGPSLRNSFTNHCASCSCQRSGF